MHVALPRLLPVLLCASLAACKVPGDPGAPRFVWVDGGGVGALRYAVDTNGILDGGTSRHAVHLMILKGTDVERIAAASPSQRQTIPVRTMTFDVDCASHSYKLVSMPGAGELGLNHMAEAANYWVPESQLPATGSTVMARTVDLACLSRDARSSAGEKAF